MTQCFQIGSRGAARPFLALLLMALTAGGCGLTGNRPPESSAPLIVPAAEAYLPQGITQEGFELSASGQGATVRLLLRNISHDEMLVGPKCFGVIAPGAGAVEPFQLGRDDHFFPIRLLRKGEGVQGFLRFNTLDNVAGGTLVFLPPDETVAPLRCPIHAHFDPDGEGEAFSPTP